MSLINEQHDCKHIWDPEIYKLVFFWQEECVVETVNLGFLVIAFIASGLMFYLILIYILIY